MSAFDPCRHCCMKLRFPKAEVGCQSLIALAIRRKPQADTRCQTGKMRRSERSPPEKVFHHSDNVYASVFHGKSRCQGLLLVGETTSDKS